MWNSSTQPHKLTYDLKVHKQFFKWKNEDTYILDTIQSIDIFG